MFQLSNQEINSLKRQSGTSSQWGGRRYPPYAFTEQGVAMLSSVLRSERAVQVNIEIMRSFVKLRQMLTTNENLARKLASQESKYDQQFKAVFDANGTMEPKLMFEIPFTHFHDQGVVGIFGGKEATDVIEVVNSINHNADAA